MFLPQSFNFIVCGSGSSGSVVARRLAENPAVSVLLLEAGGPDHASAIVNPRAWVENLGSSRDWNFKAKPNLGLNGRVLPLSMGKAFGGGSSIGGMIWARGHKSDWDFFASETRDARWGYEAVLNNYKRIENWRGDPDASRRGRAGLVYVRPPINPHPAANAFLDSAHDIGIPVFSDQNGELMEQRNGGAAFANLRIR